MDNNKLEEISKLLKDIGKEIDANNEKLEQARAEYMDYIASKKAKKN